MVLIIIKSKPYQVDEAVRDFIQELAKAHGDADLVIYKIKEQLAKMQQLIDRERSS